MVAKDGADGVALPLVAHRSTGAVGIDIAHLLGGNSGVRKCQTHTVGAALAAGAGGGDVEGVVVVGAAQNFGVDLRSSGQCVFFRLQYQSAAALANDKAVALDVEGAAGVLRVVVLTAEGVGGRQRGNDRGAGNGFPAHRQHGICRAGAQQHHGQRNGVNAGGAGGIEGEAGALNIILHGNLAGRHIAQHLGDKPGRDLLPCPRVFLLGLADLCHAVHRGAHGNAGAVRLHLKSAVFHRLCRRNEGKLGEPGHLGRLGLWYILSGVEATDLSADFHRQVGGIQPSERANAADAGNEAVPIGLHTDANGSHSSHTGDDNTFLIRHMQYKLLTITG